MSAPTASIPDHIGPYRVIRPIARGGTAEVYQVEDPASGEHLALKWLVHGGGALSRFNREYEAMNRLNHPNICRVYHYGLHDSMPYMTMELLKGIATQTRVKALGRPGAEVRTEEVVRISHDLSRALHHVHARGLVHRDLKSSNVIVLPDGRVKLLDFGTAVVVEEDLEITQDGEFVGTFAYASPEQLTGQPLDHRSDLYSLGVLMYRMATGKRPFEGKTPQDLARLHVKVPPRPPRDLVPQLPETLEQIILELMAKHPDDRPYDAFVVAERMERIAGRPLSVPVLDATTLATAGTVVGRRREREALVSFIASTEPGGSLVVVGPHGSGRVRLAQRALDEAQDRGMRALSCTCSATSDPGPVAAMMRELAEGIVSPTEKLAAALRLLSASVTNPVTSPRQRETLRRAAAVVAIASVADGTPLVLVVHHLQNAGPLAFDLLVAVRSVAHQRGLPITLILSCDDNGDRPTSQARQRLPDARRLRLSPLSEREVALMVGSLLNRRPAPPQLARRVHRASGGMPEYVEEVVRDLVEAGMVRVRSLDGNRLEWDDRRDQPIPVPMMARHHLETHLGTMPTDAVRVLEALSVAGGELDVEGVARAMDATEDQVKPSLEFAEHEGWVRRQGTDLRWNVALAESAVAERIWQPRLRVLQRRLLPPLLERDPSRALVQVLVALDRHEEALEAARRAANAALDNGKLWDALQVLDEASDALTQVDDGDPKVLLDFQLTLATVRVMLAPTDAQTARTLMFARQLAHDAYDRSSVAFLRARLQWVIGHYVNFLKGLEEAYELGLDDAPPRFRSTVATHLATYHLHAGHVSDALEWLEVAREAADRCNHHRPLAYVDLASADVELARGDLRQAETLVVAAMHRFERAGDSRGYQAAVPTWVDILLHQGRFSEAVAVLADRLQEARSGESPTHYVRLLLATANVEVELYRLGRAQELVDELEAALRPGEFLHLRLEAAMVDGRIRLASGEPTPAAERFTEVHRRAKAAGLAALSEVARAYLGEARVIEGQEELGRDLLQGATLGLMGCGNVPLLARACSARARVLCHTDDPAAFYRPVRKFIEEQPARVVRLEALLSRASWLAGRGATTEAGRARHSAARSLKEVAGLLNETDQAALRVHPWARTLHQLR